MYLPGFVQLAQMGPRTRTSLRLHVCVRYVKVLYQCSCKADLYFGVHFRVYATYAEVLGSPEALALARKLIYSLEYYRIPIHKDFISTTYRSIAAHYTTTSLCFLN